MYISPPFTFCTFKYSHANLCWKPCRIRTINTLFSVSDDHLEKTAELLVGYGLRGNTHRTYSSAQRRYLNFCLEFNLTNLPASERVLLKYIAHLFQGGLKGSSIKVYLAAVRSLHVFSNLPPPMHSEKIVLALKGAARLSAPADRKLPITYQILTEILHKLEGRPDQLVLQTAMCVTFFGCFRAGELFPPDNQTFTPTKHVTYGDLSIDQNLRALTINLKQSKTDTYNRGVEVKIGCSGTPTCAYCIMQVFISQHPRPTCDSPLFMAPNLLAIRKPYFISATKLALALSGHDPSEYSGHSYRAGSATSGASSGMSAWELKLLGRWSSDAYQIYLRNPNLVSAFAQRLATPDNNA
jgi:hypothetical protein